MKINLANGITLTRILLVPIFMLFLLLKMPYGHVFAALIFIIAATTDGLDGYIARSRQQITTFGKFLDPLADKLLICTALICLVKLGYVGVVATIIIISRDLIVSGLRSIASSEGIVIAASYLGKLKTVSQIIAISYILLEESIVQIVPFMGYIPLGSILLWISVFLTVYSGYDYFKSCRSLLEK